MNRCVPRTRRRTWAGSSPGRVVCPRRCAGSTARSTARSGTAAPPVSTRRPGRTVRKPCSPPACCPRHARRRPWRSGSSSASACAAPWPSAGCWPPVRPSCWASTTPPANRRRRPTSRGRRPPRSACTRPAPAAPGRPRRVRAGSGCAGVRSPGRAPAGGGTGWLVHAAEAHLTAAQVALALGPTRRRPRRARRHPCTSRQRPCAAAARRLARPGPASPGRGGPSGGQGCTACRRPSARPAPGRARGDRAAGSRHRSRAAPAPPRRGPALEAGDAWDALAWTERGRSAAGPFLPVPLPTAVLLLSSTRYGSARPRPRRL